jgi:orotidine-5'-phosphate decarboxylase
MAELRGMFNGRADLSAAIAARGSYLCVGLDPDPQRIPASCGSGVAGMEAFCREIVAATADSAVAFKPNLAFFEAYGAAGWEACARIIADIPKSCLVIADAKRGDIGNTSGRYASALFDGLGADAVTVAPYMGEDSVRPFLDHGPGKWTVLLALTSNPGAQDFEFHGDPPLFERVIRRAIGWSGPDRLMFVVGATRPEQLARARALAPDHFFLVPGVGAQGGTLADVTEAGWAPGCGLLVNASRSILYASAGPDFAAAARAESEAMRVEMGAELARR